MSAAISPFRMSEVFSDLQHYIVISVLFVPLTVSPFTSATVSQPQNSKYMLL